jgi:hypothetical protein
MAHENTSTRLSALARVGHSLTYGPRCSQPDGKGPQVAAVDLDEEAIDEALARMIPLALPRITRTVSPGTPGVYLACSSGRKSTQGNTHPKEQTEIDSYGRIGSFISIMKSKARMALRKAQGKKPAS